MKHELKIKPEYFAAIYFGEKTFEIRNNADRNFQVGDTLLLKAWDGEFTGDFVEKVVSYITDFEQKPGYVVMGLQKQHGTPAANWLEAGEHDPFGDRYNCNRDALPMGNVTDDALANQLFVCDHRHDLQSITLLTAGKERIRWLSRKVEGSKRIEQSMAEILRDARKYITALGKPESEISKVQIVVAQIDAIIAGQVQAQHPDDVAVDNFAKAMKEKLAKARAKGRSGWDDHAACSVEHLADLLLDHIGKGNPGTFEDIANFSMMLHQRGASPALLAGKLLFSSTPEGWQLVPVEPTREMISAGNNQLAYDCCSGTADEAWPAMLAAAPKPECCRPVAMTDMRFVVCPDCGNKRCPRANDHRNACTGSNELGQEGSAYPAAPKHQ
ncbi:DUF3850 domain-containing protein [Aeromonas hydrophila]|uniref:ASCH/PUA domain-containing protein n=1 Tax=Aeromonas hydrophila TaxID=644 RepID=UPI0021F4EEC0|nr:ASCH/PUA domain-containing protein [Aeromonas hydrophila]MCV9380446.1 DUF3850 domain-containing protein [Aeromonas hydrophila]